ncbi:MAG: Bifunctional protein GlmU [Berkelbacteria bacterium GW2011_GWA1_36_9]|uniref:Bifunctional protein GlmU n=1 Tax=Berkelbacteria bacterium GW2011_GWA1_36_9 TaxID=1618331 RepID=A0A0G0FIK4_9BACT|nr:MAG: Bifunctional protein GlmU [Berkelbacteria bacterium GW2011_GWA1_36_9]
MVKYAAIILGAGKGTRMNEGKASPIPKVMFELNGEPIIKHSVRLIQNAGIKKIIIVVGYKKEMVMDYLKSEVEYALQVEQLGTGHAVMMAEKILKDQAESIIIFYGDSPLYKSESIKKLIALYEGEKPMVAMLTVIFQDPIFWAFGRIIRDKNKNVIGIVEQKDCTAEQLKIKESNPGFYIFDSMWLWQNLSQLESNNNQKEYYLTDMIKIACEQGKKVVAIPVTEEEEALGINTPEQLKQAEEVLKNVEL